MKREMISLLLMFLPALALASGGGGGHSAEGVPAVVGYQALNLGALLIGLYFLLRKKVVAYFYSRTHQFSEAVKKVEVARLDAEKQNQEFRTRLAKIESTAAQTIEVAQKEAESLKERIIEEGEALARRLREEAKRSAETEVHLAMTELREEILKQTVDAARTLIQQNMREQDQERLQKEFVDKIQVVR